MGRQSAQLVCQHLEHVSGRLLEEFPAIIRAHTRRRHGVYALYRKRRLYYVGLAKDLRGRLKMHLRDRHAKRWDNFSIYLTLSHSHLKELESLSIRIAAPPGNRQVGKFVRSQNIRRDLNRLISQRQRLDRRLLLGIADGEPRDLSPGRSTRGRKSTLRRFVTRRFKIRWRHKGRLHKAVVRKDGVIRFNGKRFTSPSLAATAVTGRPMNGWACWQFERSPGEWVLLNELRRR